MERSSTSATQLAYKEIQPGKDTATKESALERKLQMQHGRFRYQGSSLAGGIDDCSGLRLRNRI
jgi:hypothetical protein